MRNGWHLISMVFLLVIGWNITVDAQNCDGAEISTKESFLYGRFEVRMQSAPGDGIVSSFFLYNIETNCNWPAENNEIDVEMTGNSELIYCTTHHPSPVAPWSVGESFDMGFNPHAGFHDYAMEWEPGIVRWFVDGALVYTQNDSSTDNLMYPMAILMNLWAAGAESWVGVWDPSVMPRQSKYDYVKYYSYTPGAGNAGTGSDFTFEWEDDFSTFDDTRWQISDFKGFNGNYCTFRENNVEVTGGNLILTIDEPNPSPATVPVTFSVDMNEYALQPTDVVYLNGTFNGWCGNCNPMTESDGIWSVTINLPPQRYEYLFTINTWQEIGGAPLGSYCDFNPCDEYANYGTIVPEGSPSWVLDTPCWKSCEACVCEPPTGVTHFSTSMQRVKISWEPDPAASNYQVRWKPVGTSGWNIIGNTPGNDFKEIFPLTGGQSYQYGVRKYCSATAEWSTYTPTQVFTQPLCLAPTGISFSKYSNGDHKIEWTAANTFIKYQVRYREIGQTAWTTVGTTPGVNVKRIPAANMTDGTTYEVRIRTSCMTASEFTANSWSFFSPYYNYTPTAGAFRLALSDNIHLYPNPASNRIFIQGASAFDKAEVLDYSGKVLRVFYSRKREMDISDLPSGLLLFRFLTDDNEVVGLEKVMKR